MRGGAPVVSDSRVEMGSTAATDVSAGGTSGRPVLRSHNVHRVDGRGRAADDEGFTPSSVHGGGPGTVWTLEVFGATLDGLLRVSPDEANACAVQLGAHLGRFLADRHRPLRSVTLQPSPGPWPLGDELTPQMEAVARTDELEEVLDAWFEPAVRACLALARASWGRRRRPIHGGLSLRTVTVDVSTPGMPVALDAAEEPLLGDPAWDLAMLLDTLDTAFGEPALAARARSGFLAGYGRSFGDRSDRGFVCAQALDSAWRLAADPDPEVRARTGDALARARAAAGAVAVAS